MRNFAGQLIAFQELCLCGVEQKVITVEKTQRVPHCGKNGLF
jgi:hypothetical protein